MITSTVTPAELLVYKYLTDVIEPFKSIHAKIEDSLDYDAEDRKALWAELSFRFTLIFIRNNKAAWMAWEGKADEIFSEEEILDIRNGYSRYFGKNDGHVPFYWVGIQLIDAWMKNHFRKATPKKEFKRLCEDYERHLKDAKELMITATLVYKAIADGLKSGHLPKEEVTKFANLKDLKSPDAYNYSINFLKKLPEIYRKDLDSAIGVERNYLARYDELTKHFQMVDKRLNEIFLQLILKHAGAWKEQYWEIEDQPEAYTGAVFEDYHEALDRYKRGEKEYLEHFLAVTLWGEKQHFVEREGIKPLDLELKEAIAPFNLKEEIVCPSCGYDCQSIIRDKKSRLKKKIVCPSCGLAITVEDAWVTKAIPWSELPSSFKKTPEFEGHSLFYEELDAGMDEELGDEEISGNGNGEEIFEMKSLSLDHLIQTRGLSKQEKNIIELIRKELSINPDKEISQLFKPIARKLGKTENAIKLSYYDALRKLKQ